MPQMSPMSWALIYLILAFTLLILMNSMLSHNKKSKHTIQMANKENKMKW